MKSHCYALTYGLCVIHDICLGGIRTSQKGEYLKHTRIKCGREYLLRLVSSSFYAHNHVILSDFIEISCNHITELLTT